MIAQDHLFRLIKRLSRNEKQAFTRLAIRSNKEAPLYLQLFRALNAQKAYDEVRFLSSKQGKPFAGNFPVQKIELYEKILQVLRTQRQSGGKEKPIEFRVREYLEDVRMLREKKLPDLAEKRLNQAMEEAIHYQLHELQLEVLRIQRTSLMRQIKVDEYHLIEDVHSRIATTNRIIQNKARLLELLDPLFLQAKHQTILSGRINHELLDKIMEAEELQDEKHCLSFEAKLNFHFCHAIFHQLHQRHQEAWLHGRQIFIAFQENKQMQVVKSAEYRNSVNNYLGYCVHASRYDDFELALKTISEGPFHSTAERVAALHSALAMELQRHFDQCNWVEADKVRQRYNDELENFSEHLNPSRMMLFYLSFSRLRLIQKKWPEAARLAKHVIDEGKGDPQLGMVLQARFQELIALYEHKNFDLLTKRFRSAAHALRKAEFGENFEIKILQLIHRLSEADSDQETKTLFETLAELIDSADTAQQSLVSLTSTWVQSHLRDISIAQILEEVREKNLASRPPIP